MIRNIAEIAFAASTLVTVPALAAGSGEHWVGAWSTALHAPNTVVFGTSPAFHNQTLRQIVHTSIGGDQVRIRLSTFGAGALDIGGAHIALAARGPAVVVAASDRILTFGGQRSIRIPPGAVVLSDAVDLRVPALSNLAISIFVSGNAGTGPSTWHFDAQQTSYISPGGDYTGSIAMPFVSTTHFRDPMGGEHEAWFWLAGVEVLASKPTGAIVILGDSVTDGTRSTLDTNNRWPDHLARRLMAQPGEDKMGVLNVGLAGNKLLNEILGPNGLARYDRDVLTQTGVTDVIVLLGNNDILFVFGPGDFVTADQIIAGHKQLVTRAHALGLKIYGGTLTPFGQFVLSSPEKETMRKEVNEWIRTRSEYDAVIDFDEAVRWPESPSRLKPEYDSGDHLHPNDRGYEQMAQAIDLKLFKNGVGH